LETCDEGTACREQIIAEIRADIKKIWWRVITQFEDAMEESIVATRTAAGVAWDHLVTCGEEANCCKY